MAGEGDAERLVVLLEARIKDFEKNMAKASGTAKKSYGNMRRGSHSATRDMERDMVRSTSRINQVMASTSRKIGGFGKTLIGGLVAGGIAGVVSQIGAVANGIAEVGDQARMAGLDIEAFQELKYVAEQNRIGVDALTDGIKELNLRADEFIVTGGGSAAESFARLGYDAETLTEKLKDPSALFTEIIGKLEDLDRAAQIRIADELFGGSGGEQFVQMIDRGADSIRDTIDEAHDLGLIMSEELIAKAAELDRQFNKVASTVGVTLKAAIVDSISALGDFLNAFETFNRQSTGNLEARLKAERDTREAYGIPGTDAYEQSLQREAEILAELETRAMGVLRSGLAQLPNNQPQTPPPPDDDTPPRTGTAETIDREAVAIQNLIAGLEFEKSLIGLSAVEQAKLNALRQAGATATDKQRAQISRLVEETYNQQTAYDSLQETMQGLESAASGFLTGLVSDLRQGKDATESLMDGFGNLADQLIEMALNKMISQLFSTLMSALGPVGPMGGSPINLLSAKGNAFNQGGVMPFARGGVVNGATGFSYGGGMGVMGEAGPEAIMPLKRGADGNLGVRQIGGHGAANANSHNDNYRSLRVEIVNEGGEKVEAKSAGMRREGDVDVVRVLVGEVRKDFVGGGMDSIMSQVYGLKRRGR